MAHAPLNVGPLPLLPSREGVRSESMGLEGWTVVSRCAITRHEGQEGWNRPRNALAGSPHSSAK